MGYKADFSAQFGNNKYRKAENSPCKTYLNPTRKQDWFETGCNMCTTGGIWLVFAWEHEAESRMRIWLLPSIRIRPSNPFGRNSWLTLADDKYSSANRGSHIISRSKDVLWILQIFIQRNEKIYVLLRMRIFWHIVKIGEACFSSRYTILVLLVKIEVFWHLCYDSFENL